VTTSPVWGHTPAERTKTKFGISGRVADVTTCLKCYWNRLRGFQAVRGQKWGSSINWQLPLQQVSTTVQPVIEMGRMSDYDIRPKPKVWAGSPNEFRTSAECCVLG